MMNTVTLTQRNEGVERILREKGFTVQFLSTTHESVTGKIIFFQREELKQLRKQYTDDALILCPKQVQYLIESLSSQPILISKCLTGEKCRYDGQSKQQDIAITNFKSYTFVPFCPECVALPTPRPPAGIYFVGEGERKKVVLQHSSRHDVTAEFILGAQKCLEECDNRGIWYCVLKARSPSCGVTTTNINNENQPGMGITAEYLANHGLVLQESPE